MELNNIEVAKRLREVAAAHTIKGDSIFQIRAYEGVADNVERSTSEIKDLWEEGKLDDIPGIGESIASHLDELFRTGKVKYWEEVKKGIPEGFFQFLDIPGIGPKTALKLTQIKVRDLTDLKSKLESGYLLRKGISPKMGEKLMRGLAQAGNSKGGRMILPYAFTQAEKVLNYLKKCPEVEQIDVLGSLRRMVATVGDLDFAIASSKPQEVIEYIISMPGVANVVGKGESKVTINSTSGLQLDFRIIEPGAYGAMLQYFTGSKSHNIHIRTIAERKGLSLSEYGVKRFKIKDLRLKNESDGKLVKCGTEEEFYGLLGMEVPPPEIREDTGEIELALKHQLPKLVELKDIKGDLHLHDNFPIEPSHDLGQNSVEEIATEAKKLGYEYIGISDHSPSVSNHTPQQIIELIKKHKENIEQYNTSTKSVRVLNLLEVDIQPDGSLSVPDSGLKLLDFAIASVHSVHSMPKDEMTKRILRALENPQVKVLGHPTNRLINRRGSSDADWEAIFKYAAANQKALEINAYPDRLDLPDSLVRMAKKLGVRFVIDTDSHIADDMKMMRYGVSVARRGWLTSEDVVNAWGWTRFTKWFNINL